MRKQSPYSPPIKRNFKQSSSEQTAASISRERNLLQNKVIELSELKNLIKGRDGQCNVHFIKKPKLMKSYKSKKNLVHSNFSGDCSFYNSEKYLHKIISQNIKVSFAKCLPLMSHEINDRIDDLRVKICNMEAKISSILYDLNKKINIIGQEHNSQFHHLHLKYEYQQMFNQEHFNTLMKAILDMSDNDSIDQHMKKQKEKVSICTMLDSVQTINSENTCNDDCEETEYEEVDCEDNEYEEYDCDDIECEDNSPQEYNNSKNNSNTNFDINSNRSSINTNCCKQNSDCCINNDTNSNNGNTNDKNNNDDVSTDVKTDINTDNNVATVTILSDRNSSEILFLKNLNVDNNETDEHITFNLINDSTDIDSNNVNENVIDNNIDNNNNKNNNNAIDIDNDNDEKIIDDTDDTISKISDKIDNISEFKKMANHLIEKKYMNKSKFISDIFKKTNFELFKTLDVNKYSNINGKIKTDGVQKIEIPRKTMTPAQRKAISLVNTK